MERFEANNIKYDTRLDNSKELSFVKLNGEKKVFSFELKAFESFL